MSRPALLFPLFTPASALKGVGTRLAQLLGKIGVQTVRDLVWLPPFSIIDRRSGWLEAGQIATIEGTISQIKPAQRKGQPTRVALHVDGGRLQLDIVLFNLRDDYIERMFPQNGQVVVSGRVESYQGRLQMSNPDYVCTPAERAATIPAVETVYPLTAGLTNKRLRGFIQDALRNIPKNMPEWNDAALMARERWPSWEQAVRSLHTPQSEAELLPTTPARRRLAYDEILANQLALAMLRHHRKTLPGLARQGTNKLITPLLAALPYQLTNSQKQAVAEIAEDLAHPSRMLRLLQGDVGAGKTIVALLSMLRVVEGGEQAVLMAPTEILARQHMATITKLCAALPVRIALLTGREKGKPRKELEAQIAAGEVDIIIGTHALFQESVTYAKLGFAVIDEQHRFGVNQRLELTNKGQATDVLVMTATPIPRTLLLSNFGDMAVSKLTEKPPGRTPVDTRVLSLSKVDEIIQRLGAALQTGARIYWVCPLVEESELIDLQAATSRYIELQQRFGAAVVLAHGQMSGDERDSAMQAFAKGDAQILVATTVIEVGVDVPEASIMVIEHAERFGLAQLHQLRGRIGRGQAASTCLLLYGEPLGEVAAKRLNTMRETEDGFVIAEQDLKLRGAGELLGTKQSGLPEMKHADLMVHGDLLSIAHDDAALIMSKDPNLETERGQALRVLLHLHDRKTAASYLRSG